MEHAADAEGESQDQRDVQHVLASLQTTERLQSVGGRHSQEQELDHLVASVSDAQVAGQSAGRKEAIQALAAARRDFSLCLFPVPNAFICPITREQMRDPVLLPDTGAQVENRGINCQTPNLNPPDLFYFVRAGQSYEREEITKWLQHHCTCPLTNVHLSSRDIVSNFALRLSCLIYLILNYTIACVSALKRTCTLHNGRRAIHEWKDHVLDSKSKRYCCRVYLSSTRASGEVLETGFSYDVVATATQFRKCASPWFAHEVTTCFNLTLERVELLCLEWDHALGYPHTVTQVALTARAGTAHDHTHTLRSVQCVYSYYHYLKSWSQPHVRLMLID